MGLEVKELDVTFYTNNYLLGRRPTIPLLDFPFWAQRARTFIDQYTFDQIGDHELDEFYEAIGTCTCELAEFLYSNEGSENLQSESITGRSTTYVKGFEYQICQRHLGMTGLMYRGEGRV